MIKHALQLSVLPRLALVVISLALCAVLVSTPATAQELAPDSYTLAPGAVEQNAMETRVLGISSNLILNPGNEAPLVGGEITGWQEIIGSDWKQRIFQSFTL